MISVDFPFGFTYPKNEQNVIYRYGSRLSPLLLHVYAAYFVTSFVKLMFHGVELKLVLSYILIALLSYFLWYSLQRQEKRIRRLVHKQGLLLPSDRRATKSVFFNCVIACFTLFPFAYGGLSVYLFLFYNPDYTVYSFGYPIENSLLKCLLMFFGSYGIFLVLMKWPCLALWSVCHVLNEGGNILQIYDKRLRDYFSCRSSSKRDGEGENGFTEESLRASNTTFRESSSGGSYHSLNIFHIELFGNSRRDNITEHSSLNPRKEKRVNFTSRFSMKDSAHSKGSITSTFSSSQPLMEVLTEYFKIIKMIRVLRDTVSLPSLFITMLSFSSLYSILAMMLIGMVTSDTFLKDVLINAFTGCSIIVSLGYYGAKIPQRMHEIRTTCSDIINANEIDEVLDSKELSLLKRLENVDPVHISACEFVVFSRSFILTSFGSILTFGLLLFKLK